MVVKIYPLIALVSVVFIGYMTATLVYAQTSVGFLSTSPPTISALAPTSGSVDGGTRVSIDGTNFLADSTLLTAMSAGGPHSCALDSGSAYCWGSNTSGQLGNGTTSNSLTSVRVGGLLDNQTVTAISAGNTNHTCAITGDGGVYCWGNNTYGQLGNSTTTASNIPVKVSNISAVTAITLGERHTCATTSSGSAYCWGYNGWGQLGNGTITNSSIPVQVNGLTTTTSISANTNHTCATTSSGSAYCWGYNGWGQLGNGSSANSSVPVQVSTITDVTSISAGLNHSCAAAGTGKEAFCWGHNASGQLGDGTTTYRLTPVKVFQGSSILAGKTATAVVAGNSHGCVLANASGAGSETFCWGSNTNGQLGDGTNTNSLIPVRVVGALATSSPKNLSSTSQSTCALVGGSAYCWGANASGQLGNGMTTHSNSPVKASVKTASGLSVSFGTSTGTILKATDTSVTVYTPRHIAGAVNVIVTKGDSQTATLTDGYTYIANTITSLPPTISALAPTSGSVDGGTRVSIDGTNFLADSTLLTVMSAGGPHSCALDSGSAYCWGSNASSQLGNGTTTNSLTAVKVGGLLDGRTVTAVSASNTNHTCAVTSGGSAYCWGNNAYGQLGNNTITNSSVPVQVSNLPAVTAITLGERHTCAITGSGSAYCWGEGVNGKLGNNTITNSSVPVQVSGLTTATSISANTNHTCATTSSGSAYCWGSNGWGQLGNSMTTNSSIPVQVSTITNVTSISAGLNHSCATAGTSKEAFCWGHNASSQLGDGTTTYRSTPVKVFQGSGLLTDKAASVVVAGNSHSCVLANASGAGNETYCWGNNTYGQLGDGTNTNSTVPIKVLGALATTSPNSLSSTSQSTCALVGGSAYCWGANASGQLGNGMTTHANSPVKAVVKTASGLSVSFGGVASTLVSATGVAASVDTPAHAKGVVSVRVANSGGEATLVDAYTYQVTPKITSVTPNKGSTNGGDNVTISGQDFTETTKVTFGGAAATSVTWVNATTLTVTTPASVTAGVVDVKVDNGGGFTGTLTGGYTYLTNPPDITGISPSAGPTIGGASVTITGMDFSDSGSEPGVGQFKVTIGGQLATNVIRVSATQITAKVPAHATGVVDVVVTNYDGQSDILANGYTYVPDKYAFTNAPLNIHATEPDMMTIEARDANNLPITSPYAITLTLSSSSTGGQFAINMTEDPLTRWDHTSVVLPAGQTSVNVYYKDSNKGTPTITATGPANISTTQQATIVSPYKFKVTGVTDPVASGVPSSITVTAVDYLDNVRSDYAGTISFSSTDLSAVIPSNFTFTPDMKGVYTFTNGVTMVTEGEWCVSVSQIDDVDIKGQQCAITVTPPATGTISKLAIITTPQTSVPNSMSSSAITVQTQDSINTPIAVAADTTIYIYNTSSTGEFSPDGQTNWSSVVPYKAVIKAGTTSTNFYYRDTVNGTKTVTLRDDAGAGEDFGWKNTSQEITIVGAATQLRVAAPNGPTVIDKPTLVEMSVHDAAGQPITSTQDRIIYLTSNATSGAFSTEASGVGATASLAVTIVAGTSKVAAYYIDSQAGSPQITVSDASPADGATGLTDGLVTVEVKLDLKLMFDLATAAKAGESVPLKIHAQHRTTSEPLAVDVDISIMLSSTINGEFSLSNSSWQSVDRVMIRAGQSSVTLYYKNSTAGGATLTGYESPARGWEDATGNITISAGDFFRYGFVAAPSSTAITESSSIFTVSPQDLYGNVVSVNADTTVYLYSSGQQGQFAAAAEGLWDMTRVIIPAGGTAGSFYYKDTEFGARTITASDTTPLNSTDTGIIDAAATVEVVGQVIGNIAFTTTAQTITAGKLSQRITIETKKADGNPARVSQDTKVYLNKNDASTTDRFTLSDSVFATDIDYVTIPAGEYGASFYYSNTRAGNQSITASLLHHIATQAVTVQPDIATKLAFTTLPQSIDQYEESAQIRLSVQDKYSNQTSVSEQTVVQLTSSCGTGRFSASSGQTWNDITSLTLPAGGGESFFYYKDTKAGDCKLSASGTSLETGSQFVKVAAAVRSIAFDTIAQTLEAGQRSAKMTVSLRDENGNIVPASSTWALSLYSSSASGVFTNSSSVNILVGQTSASFTYTDTNVGTPLITVSDVSPLDNPDSGLVNATQQQTIVAGTPTTLAVSPAEQNLRLDEIGRYTIRHQNAYGVDIATSNDTPVYLSSTQQSGVFTATDTLTAPGVTTVTIPAGSAAVDIYYRQTGVVAESAQLTISDVATPPESPDSGLKNGTATATFMPDEAYKLQITSPQQTLAKGQTSADIHVAVQDQYGNDVIMTAGLTVYLTSTAETGTFRPSTKLTILPGNSSVSFTYEDTIAGTPSITVADRLSDTPDAGLINATQPFTIENGSVQALNFLISPGTVERGGVSNEVPVALTNTYGVEIPAEQDTVVRLATSSPSGRFAVSPSGPWSATLDRTILAGESRTAFYYRDDIRLGAARLTASNPSVSSSQVQSLSTSLTEDTSTITVVDGEIVQLAFITEPQILSVKRPSLVMKVESQNRYGEPATAVTAADIHLRSSSATGMFSTSLTDASWDITKVTLKAGSSSASFYYRDTTAGTPTIVASDNLPVTPDEGWVNAAQIQTVMASATGPFHHFLVTNISDPHDQGNPSSVVVVAQDIDNNVVENYAGTIRFSSSDSTALLPDEYTFNPTVDMGIHTFKNGVAFLSPGEKVVTATDLDGKSGSQTDITVRGAVEGVIERLAFIEPPTNLLLERNTVSETITLQSQNSDGTPINAPTGGLPIRLTSTSTSGKFALTPDGVWQSTAVYSIPAGLNSINLYYQDNTTGQAIITGADWNNNFDTAEVANATLVAELPATPEDTLSPVDPAPGSTTDDGRSEQPSEFGAGSNDQSPVAAAIITQPTVNQDADQSPDGTKYTDDNSNDEKSTSESALGTDIAKRWPLPAAAAIYSLTVVVVILLLRESYKEIMRVYHIRQILKREKQLALDKATFLSLSGHYLRTPITILEAAASMAAVTLPISHIVASLRKKADALLDNGAEAELRDIEDPDIMTATRSALLSIYFWLPIILSGVLTFGVINLLTSASRGVIMNDMLVYTVILVIAAVLATFFIVRTLSINKEQSVMTKALQRHRKELLNAKTNFIITVQSEIKDEIARLRQLIDTPGVPNNVTPLLVDGANRLEALITKLSIASQINGAALKTSPIALPQLVTDVLARQQTAITAKHIMVSEQYPSDVVINQDPKMLQYVINTVIDNAVKFSPQSGTIITKTTRHGKKVTLSITNKGGHPPSAKEMERLFTPFNHAAHPSELTVDGLGLSLYIDNLIIHHLGGEITARPANQRNGVTIDLKLSSIA